MLNISIVLALFLFASADTSSLTQEDFRKLQHSIGSDIIDGFIDKTTKKYDAIVQVSENITSQLYKARNQYIKKIADEMYGNIQKAVDELNNSSIVEKCVKKLKGDLKLIAAGAHFDVIGCVNITFITANPYIEVIENMTEAVKILKALKVALNLCPIAEDVTNATMYDITYECITSSSTKAQNTYDNLVEGSNPDLSTLTAVLESSDSTLIDCATEYNPSNFISKNVRIVDEAKSCIDRAIADEGE